jgi:hypothetical protein
MNAPAAVIGGRRPTRPSHLRLGLHDHADLITQTAKDIGERLSRAGGGAALAIGMALRSSEASDGRRSRWGAFWYHRNPVEALFILRGGFSRVGRL